MSRLEVMTQYKIILNELFQIQNRVHNDTKHFHLRYLHFRKYIEEMTVERYEPRYFDSFEIDSEELYYTSKKNAHAKP